MLCTRNYRFRRPRTEPHTFQPDSSTVFEDYTVMCLVIGVKFAIRIYVNYRFFQTLPGFRIQSAKCMSVVDMWKKFQHSNVVQLREVFTTKGFGDQCECASQNNFPAHNNRVKPHSKLNSNCSSCISVRLSSRISNIISKILFTNRRHEWLPRSISGRG